MLRYYYDFLIKIVLVTFTGNIFVIIVIISCRMTTAGRLFHRPPVATVGVACFYREPALKTVC